MVLTGSTALRATMSQRNSTVSEGSWKKRYKEMSSKKRPRQAIHAEAPGEKIQRNVKGETRGISLEMQGK